MSGNANDLYIYPDGSVVFIQQTGLRHPQIQSPSQTTSVGKILNDKLQNLLEYLATSGLDKLQTNYNTGDNLGAHFSLEVNSGTFKKFVSAARYSPKDLPPPLYDIYQRLTQISSATMKVSTEEIPYPETRLKLEIAATFSRLSYLPGDTVNVNLNFTNKDTKAGIINPFPPSIKVLMPSLPGPDREDQKTVQTFSPGTDTVTVPPGEKRAYDLSWNQRSDDGKQAIPGWYQLLVVPTGSRSPYTEPLPLSKSYSNFLIEYPQGAMQKTITVNQSKTVSGLHIKSVAPDGSVRYDYVVDVTITLERIELTQQGSKFFASATAQKNLQAAQQPTSSIPKYDSPWFHDLPQAYYAVDGFLKNARTPGGQFPTNGVNWSWGRDREPLDPIPADAKELVFRIPQYGKWQGPWEFEVPLR